MYYKQSIISNELNKLFLTNAVSTISKCGENCLLITYIDTTSVRVEIDDKLIHINDNAYDIVKDSEIGEIKFDLIYSPIAHNYKSDSILNIKIPITYRNIDGDFGVNLVYQFNRSSVEVTL